MADTKCHFIQAAEGMGEIYVPSQCRDALEKVLNANWKARQVSVVAVQKIEQPSAKRRKRASVCDSSPESTSDKSPKDSLTSGPRRTVPLRLEGRNPRQVSAPENYVSWTAPPLNRRAPGRPAGSGNPQNPPSVASSVRKPQLKRTASALESPSKARHLDRGTIEFQGVRLPVPPEEIVVRFTDWHVQCQRILDVLEQTSVVLDSGTQPFGEPERPILGECFFDGVDDRRFMQHFIPVRGDKATDLRMVRENLQRGKYSHPYEFSESVNSVFNAWFKYYEYDDLHDMYRATARMKRFFEHVFQKVEGKSLQKTDSLRRPRGPGRPPGGGIRRTRSTAWLEGPISEDSRAEVLAIYKDLPVEKKDEVADFLGNADPGSKDGVCDNHILISNLNFKTQNDLKKLLQKLMKEHVADQKREKKRNLTRKAPKRRNTQRASQRDFSSDEEEAPMFPFRRNTPAPSHTPKQDPWRSAEPVFPTQSFSSQPFENQFGLHSFGDQTLQFGSQAVNTSHGSRSIGEHKAFDAPYHGFGAFGYANTSGSASAPPLGFAGGDTPASPSANQSFTMMNRVDDVLDRLGEDTSITGCAASQQDTSAAAMNARGSCVSNYIPQANIYPPVEERFWGEPGPFYE